MTVESIENAVKFYRERMDELRERIVKVEPNESRGLRLAYMRLTDKYLHAC
jgi:hypothetical protein